MLGDRRDWRTKAKLILVADVENCEKILSAKEESGTLKDLREVYICYKNESYRSIQLLEKYRIINREDHDLEAIVRRIERIFIRREGNAAILRNYRRLDDIREERRSFLAKVRANGAIHLD